MNLRWPLPSAFPVTNDAAAHLARGSGMAVDFAAPSGVPWFAVADAVVKVNQHDAEAGWMVWIQWFDGPTDTLYRARYCHGDQPSPLAVGAEVKAGDIIGWVGDTATGVTGVSTGPHLHFVLERYTGVWERLDPEPYLVANDNTGDNAAPASGVDQAQNDVPNTVTSGEPIEEFEQLEEPPMQPSIRESLDLMWALLGQIQLAATTQEVIDLAEQCKQEGVVKIKEACGLL